MRPGDAIVQLGRLGFHFEVAGENIRWRHEGPDRPDPQQVRPLIEVVKQHKEEVRYFLKCYCPRCGGVATCPDYEGRSLCLACDWETLKELYPGLAVKH